MRLTLPSLLGAVALSTLTALSPPARAQCVPPGTTTPSASDKATAAKRQEAKQHHAAGVAFYSDPTGHKCEEALREFSKSYELSSSCNSLKGMAVCNLELERDGDAIDQYTAFLAGMGSRLDPDEKQQIEADLNALKAAVSYVTFSANRPSVRLTDIHTPAKGYPITNRYELSTPGTKVGIHPGQHTFTASADGALDQTWQVEIANGSRLEHAFDFNVKPMDPNGPNGQSPADQRDNQVTRPVPLAVYAFGGLTVVAAGTTIGLMVWAKGKNTAYAEKNGQAPVAELEALRSGVKTANLIADIGIGVTVASAVTTAVLYVTRPQKRTTRKASEWMLAPVVGPAARGAVLTGSF